MKGSERRWINVVSSILLKDDDVDGFGIIPCDITTGTKALQASAEPTPPFTFYDVIGKRIDNPARPITICKDAPEAQTDRASDF